jgi:alpha-1,6-mannosyltransferase
MWPWQTEVPVEERRAFWYFISASAGIAILWFVGIGLRAQIMTAPHDVLRIAGIREEVRGGLGTLFLIALAFTAITVLYLIALRALRHGFPRALPIAVGGSALAAFGVIWQMPLFSPDAVHFAADVRTLWVHGTYPASDEGTPAKQDDPLARDVVVFANDPSSYGPVSYAVGGLAIPLGGESLRASLFAHKVLSGLFLLGIAAIAGLIARRVGRDGALAAGFIGLNPLMLLEFPGDGHNDTIMVFFAMAALYLAIGHGPRERVLAAVAGIAAAASKFSILVAAPLMFAYWFRRWQQTIGMLVIVGGLSALAAYVNIRGIGHGPSVGLSENTPYWLATQLFDIGSSNARLLSVGAYALAIVLSGLIIARFPMKEPGDLVSLIGLQMALFVFLCAPTLRHWYQLWALPFVALTVSNWLRSGALVFSCGAIYAILVRNWQQEFAEDLELWHVREWSIALLWLATVAVAYYVWRRDRQPGVAHATASRAARRAARRTGSTGGRPRAVS